jgi:hypothetical protein
MAGEWIKFESVTPDKPEVFQMAEILGIDPDAVVGKLVRVWVWADQQTIDGNARGVTRALLDRIASATGFADALIAVGWLMAAEEGLTFPRFDNHNGSTAKSRALAAKRAAKSRASRSERDANVTGSVTSASPREEKRREEVNKRSPREDQVQIVEASVDCPGETPAELAPDGRTWWSVESEFLETWNELPAGKRGVVRVQGMPAVMSPKDREAFRAVWPVKAEAARLAMAAIAEGRIQWDRSAMTIRAFFNSEIDAILGGGHERHEQPRRNSGGQTSGRVDSSSDLADLAGRPVVDRTRVAAGA